MAKVLVTGGAGYIGCHLVQLLKDSGHTPVVLDDLSTGHHEALGGVRLIEADFADSQVLNQLLGDERFDAVAHLAATSEVGPSFENPAGYYANNFERGLRLLEAVIRHDVRGFLFSSSAAVYGEPQRTPIDEDHPTIPTNPYGETKLAFERALHWYHQAYGLRFASLRFFNAAGAHESGDIGEDHSPESHLIPRLLLTALHGGETVPIFGDDYPTRDGTCIRDYIHVEDLAAAHLAALGALECDGPNPGNINLGGQHGYTVKEVIRTVEEITGCNISVSPAPRRAGDPATLVASSERAGRLLNWKPTHGSLREIVASAWRWHSGHPEGYQRRFDATPTAARL
ncbi:MAG: UDP-glucose 4-epimerase GalE [Acidobacteriota bacterium]|nr:UDP-glucose 4-epimerase GalE [Acidobacteriota bacterium]MDH3784650.1 UDP-glucose 4-epimerase GalE [Acidobacteriota bacterium]